MKITMVLEKWGYEGGREHHNVSMLQAFIDRGYSCSLVYGFETDKAVTDQSFTKVPKHCDPALPFFAHTNDNAHLSGFLRFMDHECPDVIYLGHVRNLATLKEIKRKWPTVVMIQDLWLVCLRVCKTHFFRRKPCDCECGLGCLFHGCFLGKPKEAKRLARYNSLPQLMSIQNSYRKFDAIVVSSRFVHQNLIDNGFDGDRIHILGYFDEDLPSSTTPLPARGNVLFVGRVDRYKGVDILIKATAKCRTHPHVVIIGDGPYLPTIQRLIKSLGMENRVDILGWVPHNELSAHFNAATVVAVPSVWAEPFCKVGIEAMARGRPVVAFDVGGISDWLNHGKTGYLVPWKNSAAMAVMIDKVYEHIELSQRMGNLGREIVLKKFSKETHIDRWETLLLDTIADFKKQTFSVHLGGDGSRSP